ncbi:2,3-bisphosphoglycerate-independent phosphoglycerate mutase [Candidatus Gottesmanbacteria bacterium]|nr:2,3-bisphosphoglycerate-independent phosphoglycerate mutase [Candidatus Gottesmanbacteria bacterium]
MLTNAPVVLLILDGWGIAPPGPGNAISRSKLSILPRLINMYPSSELGASGESVGLPPGEDGNTETGHINIGAGRIVYQDLPRINQSISDRSFHANPTFLDAFSYAKQHKTNIHLMGLVSDGGVHAQMSHLFALLEIAKSQHCGNQVFLHLFTDGRDASPNSGVRFLEEIMKRCKSLDCGTIATVMGRYFGLDRDHHWERTEKAYRALTEGIGTKGFDILSIMRQSYQKGITDEFIEPIISTRDDGTMLPRISNHDAVIFFNYRIDRPRQLTEVFIRPDFEEHKDVAPSFDPYTVKYYHKHVIDEDINTQHFQRKIILPDIFFVTMTEYERGLSASVAFPPEKIIHPFGEVLSEAGRRQLRISESEKERFVTYYFNGMREVPYLGEDRIIIPSPRVATYDLAPEMALDTLVSTLLDRLDSKIYPVIIANFANADMVAHTGNIQQAIQACEIIDRSIGQITERVLSLGGTCIITADHGNVEEMLTADGNIDTEHSVFPVPFVVVNKRFEGIPGCMKKGVLADIAPTILYLLGLEMPKEMTGKNLLIDCIAKGGTI